MLNSGKKPADANYVAHRSVCIRGRGCELRARPGHPSLPCGAPAGPGVASPGSPGVDAQAQLPTREPARLRPALRRVGRGLEGRGRWGLGVGPSQRGHRRAGCGDCRRGSRRVPREGAGVQAARRPHAACPLRTAGARATSSTGQSRAVLTHSYSGARGPGLGCGGASLSAFLCS